MCLGGVGQGELRLLEAGRSSLRANVTRYHGMSHDMHDMSHLVRLANYALFSPSLPPYFVRPPIAEETILDLNQATHGQAIKARQSPGH